MNVSCPECRSIFRVDPDKVPSGGIRARCSICGGVITIGVGPSIEEEFGSAAAPAVAAETVAAETVATPVVAAAPIATPPSPPMAHSTPVSAPMPILTAPAPVVASGPATPPFVEPVSSEVSMPELPEDEPFGIAEELDAVATPPADQYTVPTTEVPLESKLTPEEPLPVPPTVEPTPERAVDAFELPEYDPIPEVILPTPPTSATPVVPPPAARPTPLPPRPSVPSAPRWPATPAFSAPAVRAARATPPPTPAIPRPVAPARPTPVRAPINPFLANDPNAKARRLARALISDLVTYFPDRRDEGMREGTLKQLFREEIRKSYDEYVLQVGEEFAEATTHFQEALNDILAGGQRIF